MFFTNENETTAKASFTVNVNGKDQTGWRTLSTKEWQYLFNTRTMKNDGARSENLTSSGITVEGVTFKGVVLFPDNFTNQVYFVYGSVRGYYWSSSANGGSNAYSVYYDGGTVNPADDENRGGVGSSVRLITECQ